MPEHYDYTPTELRKFSELMTNRETARQFLSFQHQAITSITEIPIIICHRCMTEYEAGKIRCPGCGFCFDCD